MEFRRKFWKKKKKNPCPYFYCGGIYSIVHLVSSLLLYTYCVYFPLPRPDRRRSESPGHATGVEQRPTHSHITEAQGKGKGRQEECRAGHKESRCLLTLCRCCSPTRHSSLFFWHCSKRTTNNNNRPSGWCVRKSPVLLQHESRGESGLTHWCCWCVSSIDRCLRGWSSEQESVCGEREREPLPGSGNTEV